MIAQKNKPLFFFELIHNVLTVRTLSNSNRKSKGFNQSATSKWSLIGIPDHQGVMNVGGRLGAASGPLAFRRVFARLKGQGGVQSCLQDLGDLSGLGSDVAKNHKLASRLVSKGHQGTGLSVVVGGGHDHGYSHLVGIREALQSKKSKVRLGCINIDAHLDVRKAEPIITSGSPFYLAIENKVVDPKLMVEFGIQSHCNGPELWDYIAKKKVPVVPFEKLRHGKAAQIFSQTLKKLRSQCDAIAVSLDLDAAAAADAPGVSAPQAEGFSPSDIIEMMEIAGMDKKVISLGIFELNPIYDLDDRTARLGATAAYHFIDHALRR
jgi:formimidoylglutamase